MQKLFKNKRGKEFVFVEVPEGSINHQFYMGYLTFRIVDESTFISEADLSDYQKCESHVIKNGGKSGYKDGTPIKIEFNGEWKKLCHSKNIISDASDNIVDSLPNPNCLLRDYRNYEKPYNPIASSYTYDNSMFSITSLLVRLGFKLNNVIILERR